MRAASNKQVETQLFSSWFRILIITASINGSWDKQRIICILCLNGFTSIHNGLFRIKHVFLQTGGVWYHFERGSQLENITFVCGCMYVWGQMFARTSRASSVLKRWVDFPRNHWQLIAASIATPHLVWFVLQITTGDNELFPWQVTTDYLTITVWWKAFPDH
jgi:hypothetical protein